MVRRFAPWYSLALLALAAWSAASALAAPPAPPGFALNGDPVRGKAVYAKRCAICHGEAGDGRSPMAASLTPKPTDFTDARRAARWSDWQTYVAIRDGGPAVGLSPKMFAWGQLLPDQEVRDAAAYVRSLGKGPR